MLHVVIGHRGVGKTSFLSRVKNYYQERMLECQIFDLDREIETYTKTNIQNIFEQKGEGYFRELENKIFLNLLSSLEHQRGATYIALGAGFTGPMPDWVKVIWLRRQTDVTGRVFVDRPRLNKDISPLDEFQERFAEREERYRKIYDKQIVMSEGWLQPNPFEVAALGLAPAALGASITILPEHVARSRRFDIFLQDQLQLGVQFFELRDDLFSEQKISEIAKEIPKDKVLISFRKPNPSNTLIDLARNYKTDWACELGVCPFGHTHIASLHELLENETLEEAASRLLQANATHFKFSPMVKNLTELWSGHKFLTEDNERRSFLPRSTNGRWAWYRLLHKKRMNINFMRDGDGSSLDQPTVFDFLRAQQNSNEFAAVIGDPIVHSHTPAEQHDFFAQRRMSVLAIQMTEAECDSLNMSVLERMGLRAAAVTSPLKNVMRRLCAHVDRKAEELDAVNTIVSTKTGWSGTNTDLVGLQNVFSAMQMPECVVVWGGGGTRQVLRELLPHARFFSARRGEEIWVEEQTVVQPEVVVWALGRHRFAETQSPPSAWQPQYIIDLNYAEDSPGRDYALQTGAKYLSGKSFFKAQALAQRHFWAEAGL